MKNLKAVLHTLAGGLAAALAVAAPIIDKGLTPGEWISVALAFLSGTGLTAYTVPSGDVAAEGVTPGNDAVQ